MTDKKLQSYRLYFRQPDNTIQEKYTRAATPEAAANNFDLVEGEELIKAQVVTHPNSRPEVVETETEIDTDTKEETNESTD